MGLSRIASLLATAFLILTAIPRIAAAQVARSQSIHVLAIDSDDADEQAEALTNALRSRVRETAGWTLLETTQSLRMLTAAFQCPQRPDAACLDRIGDKLKTDQFVWGVLAKAPGHQVTAEVHFWGRGKPDRSTRETYSDNMKDANDDSLKKVALQIFGKLLGISGGTLVLHASADSGTIVVDGVAKGALDHGRATLALPAGTHTIEVQASGFATAKKEVTIDPAGTSQLEIVLESSAAVAVEAPHKPLPVRKIVGWSAIATGGILVAVGIGFGVSYLSDSNDLNTQRQDNYTVNSKTPVADPCVSTLANIPAAERGCMDVNAAHSAVIGEVTTLAIGGALAAVGIYLVATDHSSSDAAPPPTASVFSHVHLVPSIGPNSGSMVVLGRF